MTIVPFAPDHVPGATHLVAAAFASMRRSVPVLPSAWERATAYEPMLQAIAADGAGAAILDGSRLTTFIAAWRVQGGLAYVPEWGWAASGDGEARRRQLQDVYAAAAERWVEEDLRVHTVSILAVDVDALEAFSWLGFGRAVMDGIRDLAPVATPADAGITIRPATVDDVDAVAELEEGLRGHVAASPVFFRVRSPRTREQHLDRVADPAVSTLLALLDGVPVAYLRIGSAAEDAATIIRDPGTASISGAFTRPEHRRRGIAESLLSVAIEWSRDSGYHRVAVDFETANLLASRFWTRHFTPVTWSLTRRV